MATYEIAAGATTTLEFRTYDPSTGDLAPVANGLLGLRKDGVLRAPPIAGVTPTWGADGVNTVAIDSSADPAFFTNGSNYKIHFVGGQVAGNDITNDGPNDLLLRLRVPPDYWDDAQYPTREVTSANNITHNGQPIPRGDTCSAGVVPTSAADIYAVVFHEDLRLKNTVQSARISVTISNGSQIITNADLFQSGDNPNYWSRNETGIRIGTSGDMVGIKVDAIWNSGDTTQDVFSVVVPVPEVVATP